MTVRLDIVIGDKGYGWDLNYDDRFDFLYANRFSRTSRSSTLQGSYDLIMAADQETALTSIEVLPKSAYWQVVPGLQAPLAERGQVYVVEDIDDGQTQAYLTDPEYSVFYARLGEERLPGEVRWVAIADNVIMEVARDRTLAGVWLLDLPPEIALARRQARTTSGANGPARPM